ncbi:ArsR/SmtB family transcription factor [Subtercola boreus]|uniref:ArsR/SmtB family transcription factor n=1 Tax=Subtercola boreus TaxID=120213 RepID=UPI00345F0234
MNWANDAPRSAEVEQAVKVFGNRTSLGIIRYLATIDRANYGALCKALSASDAAISTHLRALEAAAVVVGDIPSGERIGRSVNYSLDPERVRVLSAALLRYALGSGGSLQ